MTGRKMTETESEVMHAWLSHDVPNAHTLRDQLAHVRVERSCICGCGSIGFIHPPSSIAADLEGIYAFEVEATAYDSEGQATGGLILILRDGFLSDVDVFALVTDFIPFPPLERLRWMTPPGYVPPPTKP
jgi:hypothetical protein